MTKIQPELKKNSEQNALTIKIKCVHNTLTGFNLIKRRKKPEMWHSPWAKRLPRVHFHHRTQQAKSSGHLVYSHHHQQQRNNSDMNLLLWLLWPTMLHDVVPFLVRFFCFSVFFSLNWFVFSLLFYVLAPGPSKSIEWFSKLMTTSFCLFIFSIAIFGLLYLVCGRVEQAKQPFFLFVCSVHAGWKFNIFRIVKTTTHF